MSVMNPPDAPASGPQPLHQGNELIPGMAAVTRSIAHAVVALSNCFGSGGSDRRPPVQD